MRPPDLPIESTNELDGERLAIHPLLVNYSGVHNVSSDDQFRAPAGWYPDPLGLPQLRWWNTQGWTEQVSAAPEPVVVQELGYAWKDVEPPVVAPRVVHEPPTPPRATMSAPLNELEGPRAQQQVDEAASYAEWSASFAPLPPAAPPAAAVTAAPVPVAASLPTTPAPSVQTPTPPAYWDADDDSLPVPSVRPEDLKFWPGTSPAELRRLAREQAASQN